MDAQGRLTLLKAMAFGTIVLVLLEFFRIPLGAALGIAVLFGLVAYVVERDAIDPPPRRT